MDEIDALSSWRSVVIHGHFLPIVEEFNREVWEEGAALLRRLDPAIFTPDDPAPQRDVLFRIAIQEITGRAALPPSRGA